MAKKRLLLISLPCLVIAIAVVFVMATRDTWEADNAKKIRALSEEATELFNEKKYERAIDKYQELAAHVQGRQIKDPQLRDILSQAAQNKAKAAETIEKQARLIELEKLLDSAVRYRNSSQYEKSTDAFKMLLAKVAVQNDPDFTPYVEKARVGAAMNGIYIYKKEADPIRKENPDKALELYKMALAASENTAVKSPEIDSVAADLKQTIEQLKGEIATAKVELAKQIEDQRKKGQALWPIDNMGNLAYVDSNGEIPVKTDLPFAECISRSNGAMFVDGLAIVVKNKKFGLLTADGDLAINTEYDDIKPSPEQIWAVKLGKKWGYLGRDGKVILAPCLNDAKPFSNGLAAVKPEKKWGFIDRTGGPAIDAQFDDVGQFGEYLAPASNNNNWGFIDRKGKYIIMPTYRKVMPFFFGRARVGDDKQWTFISDAGDQVTQTIYEDAGNFSDGMAWVKIAGKIGYVMPDCELAIPAQYDLADDFIDGLALVGLSNMSTPASGPASGPASAPASGPVGMNKKPMMRYQFIDKQGQVVLDLGERPAGPLHKPANAFKNGMCFAVVDTGRERFIEFYDKSGQVKFKAKGDSATPGPGVWQIIESLRDKTWYLVNTEGKVVWKTPKTIATVVVAPK